jgi:hypothetical protein
MSKEKTPTDTISFRCPPDVKANFIRLVESRGWTKDDALRLLVDSTIKLFEHTGGKPEWPLVVADDDALVCFMDPETKASLKRKHKETARAKHSKLTHADVAQLAVDADAKQRASDRSSKKV